MGFRARRRGLAAAALTSLVLAAACGPQADDTDAGRADGRAARDGSIRLVQTPAQALQRCRTTRYVRDACPRLVPVMSDHFFVDSSGSSSTSYGTFSLESGAPVGRGITQRNQPPRYVRVTVQAGDLSDAFDFRYPTTGRAKALRSVQLRAPARARAVFLQEAAWANRNGSLIVAPSYEWGGFHANHIAFRWSRGATDYVVSLHAWKPLAEARASLKAIVTSIP